MLPLTQRSASLILVLGTLTLAIFVLDLLTPLGMVPWLLYLFPLWLASWLPYRYAPLFIATICTALMVMGFLYSPPAVSRWYALFNYSVGLCIIWAFTALLVHRKRAQASLQASEQLYRDLVESATDIIVNLDRTGRLTFVNAYGLQVLGYSHYDVLGKSFWEFLAPASLQAAQEAFEKAERGQAVQGIDLALRAKTDEHILFEMTSIPRFADGVFAGGMAILRDIADRKRAEEALLESSEFNRQIISSAQEGIIVYDRGLRYVAWNPYMEKLTGVRAAEVLGKHPDEVFPFVRQQGIYALLERALAGETVSASDVHYSVPRTDKAGWISGQYAPHRDSKGDIIGVIATVRDVTERKQMEESLYASRERLQALSRQLLSAQESERRHIARDLHDEIGQALTALKITLQSAQRISPTAEVAPYLRDSVRLADQLLHHVRALSLELRPSLLDDLGLAAALRWYVNRQAERAGWAVEFVTDQDETRFPADVELACFRVGQEALTNAMRHSQARRVSVALQKQGHVLDLTVRDDGIGFVVSTALTHASHGGSMGLLSMQERVQLLGGQFAIEAAPMRGTLVRARFPLRETPVRREMMNTRMSR